MDELAEDARADVAQHALTVSLPSRVGSECRLASRELAPNALSAFPPVVTRFTPIP